MGLEKPRYWFCDCAGEYVAKRPGCRFRVKNRRLIASGRILENQHLLDATEIFRKLNVHKKVRKIVSGDLRAR